MNRVTPFTEQDEVGEQCFDKAFRSRREPALQRLPLPTALLDREIRSAILCTQGPSFINRESEVRAVDLLFDDDLVAEQLMYFTG